MKAKQNLVVGAGCVAGSIVLGVGSGLFWLSQMHAVSGNPGQGVEGMFGAFAIVVVFAGLAKLLFLGGLVALVMGFIQMAKEPPKS
ncbi:MAG: hypothetical protein ACRC8S_12505 [Fimbriiglobus sp.]